MLLKSYIYQHRMKKRIPGFTGFISYLKFYQKIEKHIYCSKNKYLFLLACALIVETSFPRLYTDLMTVPKLTFTELRGFHGAFTTGVACQQGALTLPDTWFRPPFWDLLMLQLLRPNSSNLPCLYSTFHLEYPLVLSRFCFSNKVVKLVI